MFRHYDILAQQEVLRNYGPDQLSNAGKKRLVEGLSRLRPAVQDTTLSNRLGEAIVKTIGDAVMAVFQKPSSAISALLCAQKRLASARVGWTPLALRVGIHQGPAIAISLNQTLDYFGSTINISARLETISSGRDLILSDAVYRDPDVQEMIVSGQIPDPTPGRIQIRGFEEQTFKIWQIKPDLPPINPPITAL